MLLQLMLMSVIFAQDDARVQGINANRSVNFEYQNVGWNKNPKAVESASVIIKDTKSGKLARVQMLESGPDTGLFQGNYQLSFNDNSGEKIVIEVYTPPQSLTKSAEQIKTIEQLIAQGLLLRKPFFHRRERGGFKLSIFDSRAQAINAFESWKSADGKEDLIDPAVRQAQEFAERRRAEEERMRKEQEVLNQRLTLEAQEKARQEEMIRKKAAESEATRLARGREAKAKAELAMQAYQKEDFAQAAKLFQEAIDLDPSQKNFSFQYGVSLYRLEQYQKAIVFLGIAEGAGVNEAERDYTMGMCHIRLKEFEAALARFESVRTQKIANLSPAATFFAGVIRFQKEQYDDAKKLFEEVLDTSEDPRLDEQAENYIEQIANIKRFEELRKKKWILGANIGTGYDSNILSQDLSQSATDLAGFRTTYGVSVEFRPIFSEKHEASLSLTVSDTYSMDKNFKAEANFQNSDPLTTRMALPYKYKSILLGKPGQIGVAPAVESTMMNQDGSGAREQIISSQVLPMDFTLVMNNRLFSTYTLEYRIDTSKSEATQNTDDDLSATKTTLGTSQTWFQNEDQTRAYIFDVSYAVNNAKGANQVNNRLDLAVSAMYPAFWDLRFLARVGWAQADYAKHTTGRKDTNTLLMLALQQTISEKWSGVYSLTSNKNTSTLSGSSYDKFMLNIGFTWQDLF